MLKFKYFACVIKVKKGIYLWISTLANMVEERSYLKLNKAYELEKLTWMWSLNEGIKVPMVG